MVSALLAAAVLAAAPATNSWKFPTGPKAELEVSTVSGLVTIRGSTTNEVRVQAVPTPPWIVEATADGTRVNIQVCCGPCKDERNGCNGDVKLVIEAPSASALKLSAVSANLSITGVTGALAVSGVSGALEIVGSAGALDLTSVSGNVKLSPTALEDISISTVSGNVKLKVPPKTDAQLSVSTVSGSVTGKRSFGSGKSVLKVSTVSGSIETEG